MINASQLRSHMSHVRKHWENDIKGAEAPFIMTDTMGMYAVGFRLHDGKKNVFAEYYPFMDDGTLNECKTVEVSSPESDALIGMPIKEIAKEVQRRLA